MTESSAESIILERYRDKSATAGGPRAGFVLRRRALLYVQPDHPDTDLEAGIEELVAKGVLKASESGDFLFLTAAGVEALTRERVEAG